MMPVLPPQFSTQSVPMQIRPGPQPPQLAEPPHEFVTVPQRP